MVRPLVWTLSLLALLVVAASVSADGVILNGISPRSIGRGGTNLAHHDNGALIFDNPAGIANVPGNGLVDVGMNVLITDFAYSNPRNPLAMDSSTTPLPQISVIRKTPDGRWAYGIGVFTPAGFSESFDLQGPPPLGGPQRYESFGMLVKILPALAWQPTDRLTIGGTLGLGISRAELSGPYFLQSPGPFQGVPTDLDLRGTGTALVWSAGMQYQLTERTSLGLAYQSESRFGLSGPATVGVPGMGETRYDSKIQVTWPQSLGLGVSHDLSMRHRVSADVLWFDWSSAFDNFDIALTDPRVPFFPSIDEQFPLRWRDTVSFRFGYEWDMHPGGILRLGYVYHRSPIPHATLTPFIQAFFEHGFSVGHGFQVWGCELDLAYMLTFGRNQHVERSGFIGGDFDLSRHEAYAHAIAVSLIRRF